jgi:hypothetical protein
MAGPGNSGKMKPSSLRDGTVIYPGFYGTTPLGYGRIQRLEKGTQRLQRSQLRPTSGIYTRLPITALHTNSAGQQIVDFSKTQVRKIGGATIHGNTAGFAYTSTTTTITWYWDGTNGSRVPVITRADGSRFTVPTAGSGLTISGLTINTTYYFLPFWNINSLCNIGWVQGTVGTPQIAFVVVDTTDPVNNPLFLMQQTVQGNEPLSSNYMTAATTAAGTGGGGAGGGGGSQHGCVMSGTEVISLGEETPTLEVLRETEWVHLRIEDGRELYCTYDHPLYHAVEGRRRADEFSGGELIITDIGEQKILTTSFHRRICSKYRVHLPKGHLYWANGLLSHNFKPL